MLVDFLIALGAVGIALAIFMVIVALADEPVRAFITALTLSYSLFFLYIFLLNKILKRKEEKHVVVQ